LSGDRDSESSKRPKAGERDAGGDVLSAVVQWIAPSGKARTGETNEIIRACMLGLVEPTPVGGRG